MPSFSIAGGLQAHFRQAEGPSRPGTEWVVVVHDEKGERRLIVRTFSDHTTRQTSEQHAAAALAYVERLLKEDSPLPAMIVVPDDLASVPAKPWWKFW